MAALYLHVPFQESPQSSEASRFAAAVVRETDRYARSPYADSEFQTLYVGGGRPSLLPQSALRTLVTALRQNLDASSVAEATLELHPADASPSFLAVLRQLGFTRLSVDARSAERTALSHTLREIRDAGFERLSVDLSFGATGQSHATWKICLQRAVDLRLPHIALHEHEGESSRSDENERADQFAFAMRFLDAKGYEQYELTHFARPGHRSRYQAHVYAHGNVLGLGPGAESFWWPDRTDPSTAERWSNVSEVDAYGERLRNDEAPVAQHTSLDRRTLAQEYILLRLRTRDGLNLNVLADRYDCSLRADLGATLDRLAAEGLLHNGPDQVRLTPHGRLLADAVTRRLTREA